MNERDVLFTKNITELMLKVMLASGDTQMQAEESEAKESEYTQVNTNCIRRPIKLPPQNTSANLTRRATPPALTSLTR